MSDERAHKATIVVVDDSFETLSDIWERVKPQVELDGKNWTVFGG